MVIIRIITINNIPSLHTGQPQKAGMPGPLGVKNG